MYMYAYLPHPIPGDNDCIHSKAVILLSLDHYLLSVFFCLALDLCT